MISGIAPYRDSYLILAYLTEDMFNNEATIDPAEQRRKAGSRPELRIISKDGEELSSDAISLRNYDRFQCRDYSLCPAPTGDSFYVISPQDIVLAEPRDEADHITWLIEQKQYEPALLALEKSGLTRVDGFDLVAVGKKYLEHLIHNGEFIPSFLKSCVDVFSVGVGPIGEYAKAASSCPKILGINAKLWEEWVFLFAGKGHLQVRLLSPGPFFHDGNSYFLSIAGNNSLCAHSRPPTQSFSLRDDPLSLPSQRPRCKYCGLILFSLKLIF